MDNKSPGDAGYRYETKLEGYHNGVKYVLEGPENQVIAIAKYVKYLTPALAKEESRVGG